jgi:hypothetical protein
MNTTETANPATTLTVISNRTTNLFSTVVLSSNPPTSAHTGDICVRSIPGLERARLDHRLDLGMCSTAEGTASDRLSKQWFAVFTDAGRNQCHAYCYRTTKS